MVALRSRRLEALFGARLDDISHAQIKALVPSAVSEDFDLDFKEELYGRPTGPSVIWQETWPRWPTQPAACWCSVSRKTIEPGHPADPGVELDNVAAHDNAAGTVLLDKVAADTDTVKKALVDQGFKNTVVGHGAGLGIDVEIVERNPADRGLVPVRWRVEQTNGTLMLYRRLVRDCEHRPASSESRVYWAISDVMAPAG